MLNSTNSASARLSRVFSCLREQVIGDWGLVIGDWGLGTGDW
ncbi:hypothetical protein [Sphaerospermopsis kisseleviana]|nr:hypothetical protein [Sphaerospermopsis kisseleviana]